MSKKREVKVRGKPAVLEEIDNIYAIRADKQEQMKVVDADGLESAGIKGSALQAFRDAGWQFVRAAERAAADAGAVKVFVRSGGRIVLGTNRLTVKVNEKVTQPKVADMLTRHGGKIVGQLKFAPNLYHVVVDLPPGQDVLDVAGALDAEESVEFAEPEFVEFLGGR